MTAEDRASKAMAECIAENEGKNMAFYLTRAIRAAIAEERAACAEVAVNYDFGSNELYDEGQYLSIAKAIRVRGE